jgi:hypothetical protein
MNIQTAIDRLDEKKPNMMSRKLKIAALSELDGLIFREVILKHAHPPLEPFTGYDEDTDPGTELVVPFPYDELYGYWLMTKVDEQNLETAKYENDRILFNSSYQMFQDYWRRTHMPLTRVRELRI